MRLGKPWAAVIVAGGVLILAKVGAAAPAVDLGDPPILPATNPAAPPPTVSPPAPDSTSPAAPAAHLPAPVPAVPAPPTVPARAPAPVVSAPARAPTPAAVVSAPAVPSGPVPWPLAAPLPTSPLAAAPLAAPPCASSPQLEDFTRRTKVGAYGAVQLFVDADSNATAKLPLAVLSVEHRPTDWARIAVAIQAEDGTTTGVQQALVEVSPVRAFGLRAGLLIVPLGLGNLSPEPLSDLTVDRPLTDQLILPAIWRELGAGVFGELGPGLRYQGAVVSGLDATGLSAAAPLWGTRGDGSSLAIHDAAVVGRLELDDLPPGLVIGGGGYTGGASHGVAALSGVRVAAVEADLRYHHYGLDVRAEYARLYVVNSYLVNDYLGLLGQSAVPARGRGYYVEAGYDLLRLAAPNSTQELVLFGGYEDVNPRSDMSPYNHNPPTITGPGQLPPEAPSPPRRYVRGGIVYRPLPSLALKVDLQVGLDGEGPAQTPLSVMAGTEGTPRTVGADVAEAARGATRVGLALAFGF